MEWRKSDGRANDLKSSTFALLCCFVSEGWKGRKANPYKLLYAITRERFSRITLPTLPPFRLFFLTVAAYFRLAMP